VAPRHRSNDFRFELVCRRGFPRRVCYARKNPKLARDYPQYSKEELPVIIRNILTRTPYIYDDVLANAFTSFAKVLGLLPRETRSQFEVT
ncbi:hypothetical protein A2U01_0045730, partial [Trifolium medium]|nr:hypothetical protein [Trifolium medium]